MVPQTGQIHAPGAPRLSPSGGRQIIAVVGIDRYAHWPRLDNAVNDASGALERFQRLGFEAPPGACLFDEAATGDAIRKLVTDDLRLALRPEDSLVLFFAGHGYTSRTELDGGVTVKTGYLIGASGERPGGAISQWVRLDTWLSDVSRLPPRHILVILDACRSGVALGALIKHRDVGVLDEGARDDEVLGQLRARRSRRVITSALDEQRARDGGPVPGHSLFTGYLIEGLERGVGSGERRVTTGSELGLYLQQRVGGHPGSEQTPDFGALELDDRGELVLELGPVRAGGGGEGEGAGRPDARWARALIVAAAAVLATAALLVLPGLLIAPATPAIGPDARSANGPGPDARSADGGVDAAVDAREAQGEDAGVVPPPDAGRREIPAYAGPCRLETYGEVTAGGPSEYCAARATPAERDRARELGKRRVPKLQCMEVYRCR